MRELCNDSVMPRKGSRALDTLKTLTLTGIFGNASTLLEAEVCAWVQSHTSSEPIYTSPLATVATITISSGLAQIFVCHATRATRELSFSVTNTSPA